MWIRQFSASFQENRKTCHPHLTDGLCFYFLLFQKFYSPFRCRIILNTRTLFYTDTALFDRNAFNHRNRDGRTYFGVPRDRGRQGRFFFTSCSEADFP
jgi:hypothetical protein